MICADIGMSNIFQDSNSIFSIAHGFLFHSGSKLLIRELPSIFDGSASGIAEEQDDSKATLAPKVKITPVQCFHRLVHFFPVSSVISKSNGEVGA